MLQCFTCCCEAFDATRLPVFDGGSTSRPDRPEATETWRRFRLPWIHQSGWKLVWKYRVMLHTRFRDLFGRPYRPHFLLSMTIRKVPLSNFVHVLAMARRVVFCFSVSFSLSMCISNKLDLLSSDIFV